MFSFIDLFSSFQNSFRIFLRYHIPYTIEHTNIYNFDSYREITITVTKCRGGVTADAIGWLKMRGRWTLEAPGRVCTHELAHDEHNTHGLPRFGAPVRR